MPVVDTTEIYDTKDVHNEIPQCMENVYQMKIISTSFIFRKNMSELKFFCNKRLSCVTP